MEIIKGYIEHISVHKEDTGFTVMNVSADDETIICVGIVRGFSEGESVEVTGEYVVHPVYKRQLKIKSIKSLPPENKVAVERYLGSGAIKGVGEALAKRIVKTFGEDTFRIAMDEPERLAEVKGISIRKAYEIGAQLAEKKDIREIMIFLQGLGISQNYANKIYTKYGRKTRDTIEQNPYKLAEDIRGIGFKLADDIAGKMGISYDSEYRVRCGIVHIMLQSTVDGNCYYPKEKLVNRSMELLTVPEEMIEQQLLNLIVDRSLKIVSCEGENRVYFPSYYIEEEVIAHKLAELLNSYDDPYTGRSNDDIYKKIKLFEKQKDISLDELQRNAVCQCMRNGVFVLTGGPGTGKTTTINLILDMLEDEGLEFYLAAPTGRAAKRIQETTGYEASTLHRLLEVCGDVDREDGGSFFDKNADNPIEADVIIVDEMSMVDIHLFKALLNAIIPGTKLILVGDSYQLASVGPGQILGDIIKSGRFPGTSLEHIYRQDENGHIITYAHMIKNGEIIDFTKKYRDFFLLEKDSPEIILDYMERLMKVDVPKAFNISPLDIQVLSPMKKSALGTIELNDELQRRLNPASDKKAEMPYGDSIFRTGDKVMQTKNNYELEWRIYGNYNIPIDEGKGIFNGDVGFVKEINKFNRTIVVVFDDNKTVEYPFENLDELELAYAMTIHKSQGSEYPVIIIPLLSGPSILLTRNLLYTAVTRAKECVILLGSSNTVGNMIVNDLVMERYSSLDERIEKVMDEYEEEF